MNPALVGTWVAALLTLIVLSYLISDNPLYRLAEHVFIGISVGWTFVLLYNNFLINALIVPLSSDPVDNISLVVPLVLGLLLLTKLSARFAWLGNSSMGFLVGAGVSLAISGALAGMLVPQLISTMLPLLPNSQSGGILEVVNNLVIIVTVIAVLLYFNFTRPKAGLQEKLYARTAVMGRSLMMVAFGALFASLLMSRISVLVGRIYFLFSDWLQIVQ